MARARSFVRHTGVTAPGALAEARSAAALEAGAPAEDVHALHDSVAGLRKVIGTCDATERRELVVALLGEDGIVMAEDEMTATIRVRTGSQDNAGLGPQHVARHGTGVLLELRLVA